MNKNINLFDILPGEKAVIKRIAVDCDIKRRLLDIGLIENTVIECVGQSPFGDPKAYCVRGAIIALRSEDCKKISVARSRGEKFGSYC